MPKSITRSHSRYSREAAALLGALIRAASKERGLSAQELAERAGISRGLLQRIEKGDLKCEIGAAFEAATIVGVRLFDVGAAATGYGNPHEGTLAQQIRETEDKLALLPKSVRKKSESGTR
ncbi:MAG: helix-turn-helix domain-containing protein [Chromatiales bacterium]|jgi:transcriptional regulator with XRE-family HTH domain|nr:helix-turn-helix domain-containing protein [Chromatiales bacterium]